MSRRSHRPLGPRLILGLLSIALGVAFTLHNLGLADLDDLFPYWPVLLIVVGIGKLLAREHIGGSSWCLAGGVLLLPVFVDALAYRDLWPLLLILVGLAIVGRALPPGLGRPREQDAGASALAIMSASKRINTSEAFEGADLTAIMGGCELDLRGAGMRAREATIEAFAFWGGIVIRVPHGWSIDLRVLPLMGGAEDYTRAPDDATAPRLTVRGVALMGGVEVRN